MPFHEVTKDGGGSGKLCVAHGAHTEESGNRDIDADMPRHTAWATNYASEQWTAALRCALFECKYRHVINEELRAAALIPAVGQV